MAFAKNNIPWLCLINGAPARAGSLAPHVNMPFSWLAAWISASSHSGSQCVAETSPQAMSYVPRGSGWRLSATSKEFTHMPRDGHYCAPQTPFLCHFPRCSK
jgi:hypothetical protein